MINYLKMGINNRNFKQMLKKGIIWLIKLLTLTNWGKLRIR